MKFVQRVTRKCQKCGKEFQILPSTLRGLPGRGKYCSASCRSKVVVKRLVQRNKAHEFVDAQRESMNRLHVYQHSNEALHPRWKGNDAGYYSIHDWITKHYGQPVGCDVCGLNDSSRKYHWANLSHEYRRDRSDFKRMCVSCHRKYDYAEVRRKNADKKKRV